MIGLAHVLLVQWVLHVPPDAVIRISRDTITVVAKDGRAILPGRDVKDVRRADGTVDVPSNGPVAQESMASDKDVSTAVRRELREDPALGTQEIEVRIQGGKAVLRGSVDSLADRERAMAIASTVSGVRDVEAELEITARPDREVEEDLRRLLGRPVDVENGVVRLRSGVGEDLARRTRGVRELRVGEAGFAGTGEELRRDIQWLYRWDAYLDHEGITVETNEGTVTLKGVVSSAAEKTRAVYLARVAGARSVDTGRLTVEGWRRNPAHRKSKFANLSDEDIERAVDRRLRTLGVLELSVDVSQGKARLNGEVPTVRLRREAARRAREVVGVRSVSNEIQVQPSFASADEDVAERVRAAFDLDPRLNPLDLDVAVREGVLRLSGRVRAVFLKAWADEIAGGVEGVRAIENSLRVSPGSPPLVSDPYVDDWNAADFNWYTPPTQTSWRSDADLRDAIEKRFYWSPFVDEEKVRVTVVNGQVQLTGSVDTLLERDAAEREARRVGAPVVANDLIVR